MKKIKPPLGLTPKYIVREERRSEIAAAVKRYLDARMKIPLEWIEEHNEHIK